MRTPFSKWESLFFFATGVPHRILLFVFVGLFALYSCTDTEETKGRKATYVKPTVDTRGRVRKGHIRMPSSTKKNVNQNRNRSRYYYHTRGKYRKKKKKE